MAHAPLVSVLIPSFNHERFIVSCLDSVLNDGYPNLELLLVDDGSTDATFDVASRWAQAHAQRFQGGVQLMRQQNQGLVRTLNRLVNLASGEYFTLLASDDCLVSGGIEARVSYLQRRREYLAVFADAIGVNEAGARVCDSVLEDRYRADRRALRCDATRGTELILQWCVPGPVFLARRSVVERIGAYDERYCFEDRDYYLRLIDAGALGFIDRPVALYRFTEIPTVKRYSKLQEHFHLVQMDHLRRLRGFHRLALKLLVASEHGGKERGRMGKLQRSVIRRLLSCLKAGNRVLALLCPARLGVSRGKA